ncbi:MAG: cytochrome C [Candidatus Accumulibacter sp. 66-26]|nr:MAG: cytochrome C [Candidatus Accumulibacter sp. 66-26]
MKKIVAALVLAGFAAGASAQMKPEDAIKFRQSTYGFMAWNMGKIKASLEGAYNKEEVAKAAHAIAVSANSGMGALYLPGTDKGTGWKETRLKSEFFSQQEEVGKIARAFNAAANELDKAAASGDAAAVKVAFGKTGEGCKACHDKFRKD